MTVAHVTGAARGIGKAIALRLAQDGHNVAISDLPSMKDELEVTRKDVESHGVRAVALTGDVSDHESVRRLMTGQMRHSQLPRTVPRRQGTSAQASDHREEELRS
jgi:meso-butanediol dehydrogenase / (S,S)-butanediol dehydrogenase / diacetyl reductase